MKTDLLKIQFFAKKGLGLALAMMLAGIVNVQPSLAQTGDPSLKPEMFADFQGVDPNGQFRFALQIDPEGAFSELAMFGLEPGQLLVKVNRDGFITESQEQMRDLLVGLPPGDTATLTLLDPTSGDETRLRLTGLSAADMFVFRQMAEARRQDEFGLTPFGFRLRLVADGSFEALDVLIAKDIPRAFQAMGPYAVIAELFLGDAAESLFFTSRYSGLASMYGLARIAVQGTCGEPVDEISVTIRTWTEYRNGFGRLVDQTPVQEYAGEGFAVPLGFGRAIADSQMKEIPPTAIATFYDITSQLPCNSETRKTLERNFAAYLAGRKPVFRLVSR